MELKFLLKYVHILNKLLAFLFYDEIDTRMPPTLTLKSTLLNTNQANECTLHSMMLGGNRIQKFVEILRNSRSLFIAEYSVNIESSREFQRI